MRVIKPADEKDAVTPLVAEMLRIEHGADAYDDAGAPRPPPHAPYPVFKTTAEASGLPVTVSYKASVGYVFCTLSAAHATVRELLLAVDAKLRQFRHDHLLAPRCVRTTHAAVVRAAAPVREETYIPLKTPFLLKRKALDKPFVRSLVEGSAERRFSFTHVSPNAVFTWVFLPACFVSARDDSFMVTASGIFYDAAGVSKIKNNEIVHEISKDFIKSKYNLSSEDLAQFARAEIKDTFAKEFQRVMHYGCVFLRKTTEGKHFTAEFVHRRPTFYNNMRKPGSGMDPSWLPSIKFADVTFLKSKEEVRLAANDESNSSDDDDAPTTPRSAAAAAAAAAAAPDRKAPPATTVSATTAPPATGAPATTAPWLRATCVNCDSQPLYGTIVVARRLKSVATCRGCAECGENASTVEGRRPVDLTHTDEFVGWCCYCSAAMCQCVFSRVPGEYYKCATGLEQKDFADSNLLAPTEKAAISVGTRARPAAFGKNAFIVSDGGKDRYVLVPRANYSAGGVAFRHPYLFVGLPVVPAERILVIDECNAAV